MLIFERALQLACFVNTSCCGLCVVAMFMVHGMVAKKEIARSRYSGCKNESPCTSFAMVILL